jgi:indole-3-glycerol phosphate synthase
VICTSFDPLTLARIYQENGASAISVLTDEHYFKGSLDYLRQIADHSLHLPLLRKDFIFNPYQVYEARAAGADAILLIAAYLQPIQLSDLHTLANELGMSALVEIHNKAELDAVMTVCHPSMVGINNRNLHDFSVTLETTLHLRPYVPVGICLVAESGIHTRADVDRLGQAGIDAVLVGEALVAAPDVAAQVRSLVR